MFRLIRNFSFLLLLATFAGCSSIEKNRTPISHVGGDSGLGHMLNIDAKVSEINTLLIFDTGIGINLISKDLCKKLNCKISGSVKGKRTTGQSVTIPTAKIKSLKVANFEKSNVTVGILDLKSFLPNKPEFKGITGYLSLTFFEQQPFTVDYLNKQLILENQNSLKNRFSSAHRVPLTKKYEDGALTIQIPVKIPTDKILKMQLDLGTNIMSLNNRYVNDLKPLFIKNTIKSNSLVDETNFKRERFFVKIKGEVKPEAKSLKPQKKPTVMFQKMLYDGMIGNDFFKDRVTTYDLENSILAVGEK